MPVMTAAAGTGHFDLNHPEVRFARVPQMVVREGQGETRPTGATVIFPATHKERQATQAAGEDPFLPFIGLDTAEWRFSLVVE